MSIVLNGQTGEIFPTWATSGRPSTPSTSQTGFNTTIGTLETYNGTYWAASDAAAAAISPIQTIGASVSSNALTVTATPGELTFRNATLTSGTPVTVSVASSLSLTVPSSATLGTVSTVQAQLMLLVLYNAGSPVLAIVNASGGVNLDETTLISTTAISSSATSASTVYSSSAITNSPFRLIGYITITETTAGTWATAPTLVQGAGGMAMPANAMGVNQTWQTPTRTSGTTYYNTTGRPIEVVITSSTGSTISTTVNGTSLQSMTVDPTNRGAITFTVPISQSYVVTALVGSIYQWSELR